MTTSLRENAYHVLGLTGTATSKQILQRSNEIVQRLKIDDVPEYELDMPAFKNYRTEDLVRDALRRLQAPKARLREYFFWFRISDEIDKQAAKHLGQRDFDKAIAEWQSASNEQISGGFAHKRNLALALTISLLYETDPSDRIESSLSTWASLLDSTQFWKAFGDDYKHDAELLSEEAVSEFQRTAASDLSDVYAEIQESRGGGNFVYRFQQLFNARGKKIEENILNPVFQAIQKAIEQLEQVKLGETDNYDSAKARQLKGPVAAIQAELNKLIEEGLYDDSTAKLLRDRAAAALRAVVLDIHNHHDDLDTASKLLQLADKIAGTDSLRALLKADLDQIQKNISYEQDNTLAIEIPGTFGGGTIIFKPDHVTYNGRKIYYKDASRISYHAISQSINLVPVSQSYSYMIGSPTETIEVSFGTTLYIGNKKKKDAWARLAGVSQHVIEPQIVKKLVHRIFADGETIAIGRVEFTRDGYSRSKLFGGRETVSWSDKIFIPQFASGNVILWKNKDGKAASFESLSTKTPNAVVLPELVKECYALATSHAKR
ncbi:MAG: hypothetical protein ACYC7B_06840 [Burkholderiales bacterium]